MTGAAPLVRGETPSHQQQRTEPNTHQTRRWLIESLCLAPRSSLCLHRRACVDGVGFSAVIVSHQQQGEQGEGRLFSVLSSWRMRDTLMCPVAFRSWLQLET